MLIPSIFGENLFDDWMRLPVQERLGKGMEHRTDETDIRDVDGNYELSMELRDSRKRMSRFS